jgi:hypothetical protein
MAGKLTARKVQTAKPGKYSDGGNLYLIVADTGTRKWVLRFTWRGRAKEMGLGSATSVPLADAREKAAEARHKIARALNPIDERKRDGGIPTFGQMADEVLKALSPGFRNDKHKAQWKSTLGTYAAPLRGRPVDTITTDDVLAVLKPIWLEKAETASRVRGRIEKVLDAAKAKGFRDGENPARWRGHLDHLLPRRSKLTRPHHPAMPYEDVPAFIGNLREVSRMRRSTGSVLASVTGPATCRPFLGRSLKPHSPMSLEIKPNRPTGEVTHWKNGASSWKPGQGIARGPLTTP